MKILFVCLGNTCRSPIAEGLGKKRAAGHGLNEWEIESAGTLGLIGEPASENAILACEEMGVNIGGHRSRGVTPELLRSFDYVFGMENAQIDYCKELAPGISSRIFLIGGFGSGAKNEEVPDPVGSDLRNFRKTRDLIREHIERIFPEIENETRI